MIASLIVAGALGFLTLEELYARRRAGNHPARLTLHTTPVLATTVALLLGSWGLYSALEWNGGLAGMSAVDRVANALFMSVTARTAGFNTVDYSTVSAGGSFLTILLMIVGGSPGSGAGGHKTTTLALVVLLAWSRIRGHRTAQVFQRSVPDETVHRAVGLIVVVGFVLVAAIFMFAALEVGGPASVPHELEVLRYPFVMGATDHNLTTQPM